MQLYLKLFSIDIMPALPRNVFYEDHTILVVILYTVWQSFPCQLLFQCWDPYDILHWTFHNDTFCLNKHTQGKLSGHIKFWYPSRDCLGWRWSIFEKTGETPSVTRGLRTGYIKKFQSIRINLRDLTLTSLYKNHHMCLRIFEDTLQPQDHEEWICDHHHTVICWISSSFWRRIHTQCQGQSVVTRRCDTWGTRSISLW